MWEATAAGSEAAGAQHSEAPHSEAPHSEAPHSEAPHAPGGEPSSATCAGDDPSFFDQVGQPPPRHPPSPCPSP